MWAQLMSYFGSSVGRGHALRAEPSEFLSGLALSMYIAATKQLLSYFGSSVGRGHALRAEPSEFLSGLALSIYIAATKQANK